MSEQEMAESLRKLAELSRDDTNLPDPALIWWKAQLDAQHVAEARATRPLVVVEWASLAASVAAVVLIVCNWQGIPDLLQTSAAVAPWVSGGVIFMGLALRFVFGE